MFRIGMGVLHPGESEHRFHKFEFAGPVAVYKFLPAVMVAEVCVETNLGKFPNNLNSSPQVLGDRRAMGLEEYWEVMLVRGGEDGLDEAICIVIVFQSPTGVYCDEKVATLRMPSGN